MAASAAAMQYTPLPTGLPPAGSPRLRVPPQAPQTPLVCRSPGAWESLAQRDTGWRGSEGLAPRGQAIASPSGFPHTLQGSTRGSSSTKSLKPPRGLGEFVPRTTSSLSTLGAAPTARGPLRFISVSASRQHPLKRDAGYVYADAVARTPRLLGVCDGVSGVQQLGLQPDELPRQLLEECSKGMDHSIALGEVPCDGDGHWLMTLLQEAYDRTLAFGATTVLLAAMEDSRRFVVANVGDCGLLLLRPEPSCPSRLSREFRTDELRYEANKPVQVTRLANTIASESHLVISGARMNTVSCQRGDLLVLGSDGIFDNLRDEDITQIVEKHCTPGCIEASVPSTRRPLTSTLADLEEGRQEQRLPAVKQLEQTAVALVDAAIRNVQSEEHEIPGDESTASRRDRGNADDTTAIVAVVVEADDLVKAELVDAGQAQTFRVGSRKSALSTATDPELGSWAAGSLLGFSGMIPQCCNTSADHGDEFEEYLLCKDSKVTCCKSVKDDVDGPSRPEECALS